MEHLLGTSQMRISIHRLDHREMAHQCKLITYLRLTSRYNLLEWELLPLSSSKSV